MADNSTENSDAYRNLKPFKKGRSGNPGGRPKAEVKLRELARENTLEAVETLLHIMRSETASAPARVSAANSILERGYGKAPLVIDATVTRLSEEERHARIVEILEGAVENGTSGSAGSGETVRSLPKPH